MHLLCFWLFLPSWLICLESKDTVMGFGTFFFRISKFIWGMSLADRTIIWNKLQEIASSGEKYYSKNLHSRFKVQSSEKTSSVPPVWTQDSRFKAEGLRIQKVFLGSWILNPTPLDSRSLFGILSLESWSLPPWIQEVFLGSWILSLESDPLDSRSLFGILNLESYPLDSRRLFLDLESWILPPWIQEAFSDLESWILNLESYPWDSRSLLGILNLESWIRCT